MLIAGRYRPLGAPLETRGTWFSTAQDLILGGIVFLKLRPLSSGAEAMLAEALLLEELEHPRLVRLVDTLRGASVDGAAEPMSGFATAWMDAEPFVEAVRDRDLSERVAVFGGLLDVVDYLHRSGLLHLDLKPGNVLGSVDQGVTLLDLGTARPLDGGPGEAGGTLGYAAPEVLARQAASVMSDVYSLGAILYELLTGARPHGELEPRALRQACLNGDVIPPRAVAPSVPRALARLCQDMLARSPARRPRSVAELRERLADAGFPLPRGAPGAPPFVGRERELRTLVAMLRARKASPVAVVGRSGSGRTRLALRAVREVARAEELPFVDLTARGQPLLALHRILALDHPDMVPPGAPGWLEAAKQRLSKPLSWKGLIYLGRLERLPPEEQAQLEALLPLFATARLRAALATERIADGATSLPLASLSPVALESIGHFLGAPTGPALRKAVERSDGSPERLIRQLAADLDLRALPKPLLESWQALATLPGGLGERAIEALPPELRGAIPQLRLYGLIFTDGAGLLQLVGQLPGVDVHPSLQESMRGLLRASWADLDPLWAALTAARLGEVELALTGLEGAVGCAGPRRAEMVELAERLAATGARDAALTLARLRLADANPAGALDALALDGLGDDDEVVLLRVQALWRSGRLPEAEAEARRGLEGHARPLLRLELARLLGRRGAQDEALRAVEEAYGYDPALADGQGLAIQVLLLAQLNARGEETPGLRDVLRRVERLAGSGTLPASTLSTAGRAWGQLGELERGVALLERAGRIADRDGDLRLSAVTRLNLGNALLSIGRGQEARRVYAEALLIARAADQREQLIRLSYSLANLELRMGRLPAAETHLEEFKEIAARFAEPQAALRARILEARLCAERGQYGRVLDLLRDVEASSLPQELGAEVGLATARALLETGRTEEALAALDGHPESGVDITRRQITVLRGRIYLALGRAQLQRARAAIEEQVDPLDLIDVGEVLFRAAGEDLEPESFVRRRADLDQAARLLKGPRASWAASLRDRLLEGPGVALEGIVELTEAMQDPQGFPVALARLITESLGAHRVLIMLKLPGLGRQMTYQELAGEEAAGIGKEVLQRIQRPDDVWQAADAFADPALREASATVRTFEIKSLLAVAIPFKEQAIGALYVDDLHRADRFTRQDVELLKRLAAAVGRIIALIPVTPPQDSLFEPQDVLGVMLQTRAQVQALEDSLELLHEPEQTNLLVTGPTGAGKTWFARRVAEEVLGLEGLEELAVRQMDPQMLVSVLTGTRRGEFTGAITQDGVIQKAIAGRKALFIDEVQSLDESGQQILLPLLELPERRFGGLMTSTRPIEGRLHVILGTNVDVAGKRWARHFRDDLWYRMSRVHVDLPPLAERGPEAVYRYLHQMLGDLTDAPPEALFDVSALQRVTSWEWPGNLRELSGFADKAAALFKRSGKPLGLKDLPRLGLSLSGGAQEDGGGARGGTDQLVAVERETVLNALRRSHWVQADAARRLGITRWTMHRMLKKHDLVEFVRLKKEESGRGEG
ncbi:MAG: sigma 54-interacting transcriptional regulator [Alphaproteobacteria bacterium]|nr:sigma 54-interacting transcriptional regulator [Alphaproteobacteria bacterium]